MMMFVDGHREILFNKYGNFLLIFPHEMDDVWSPLNDLVPVEDCAVPVVKVY